MSAKIQFYSFATKCFINYFTFDAVGEQHFHARFQSFDNLYNRYSDGLDEAEDAMTEQNNHKQPNEIFTNNRTESPQTTEQNLTKRPKRCKNIWIIQY